MLRRDCGYFEHMNEFETSKIYEPKNVIFAKKVNKKERIIENNSV